MLKDLGGFRKLINEQFLLYAWNSLKSDEGSIKIFEPISKNWFKKCAFLMRKGVFPYDNLYESNNKILNKKKNSLKLLKYKIIERAIVSILILRLERYTGFEKSNSIKYVCKLFKNSFLNLIGSLFCFI